MRLSAGDRIRFHGERQWYTARAIGPRYAVCTKPFAPRKTVIYTILDFNEQIRGTENLIFCMGFETDTQCSEALARLEAGESAVSHRNRVPLDISAVRPAERN